jgi:hypothetical protein
MKTYGMQIEMFERSEHLKQHDAAARRLVGRNSEIAIIARKWRVPDDLKRFEIGPAQKATMRPHVCIDRIRDLAPVK